MIDMHAHPACFTETKGKGILRPDQLTGKELELWAEEELELRAKNGILTCFSTGTPWEWQRMQPFRGRGEIRLSFGIHPWYSDRYEPEEYREYLEQCDFVGEIGMDSVWCDIPLSIQQKHLEEQLRAAADLKKPVILHTKGQEEKIADIIRDFPGKVCVHWYSGPENGLERFLKRDCYFTLGPDTACLCRQKKDLNLRMVREIPASRLFVETDGISAVAWARGVEQADPGEIPLVLKENLEYAAMVKGLSAEALEQRMEENLREFLED